MATATKCGHCGEGVQMTRMSMVDFESICYPCKRKEEEDLKKCQLQPQS